MSDQVRVLTNLTMARNAAFNLGNSVNEFPADAKHSDIVVVEGVPYFYTQVSGVDTWFPLAQRQNTYLHTQGIDALEWLVNHGLGTQNLIVMVYDANGNVQQASIEFIDNENIRIRFTTATKGRAVLFGMDQISAPSIRSEKIVSTQMEVGGTALVVDESGNVVIEGADYSDTIAAINAAHAELMSVYSYDENNATITRDLTVQGTLQVMGEVISTNTETVNIQDNIILLNSNVTTGAPTENAGLAVSRGDRGELVFIQWNEAAGQMEGAWRDPDGGVISMKRLATEGDVDHLQTQITDNANAIGTVANLQTATQASLVDAVNEVLTAVDTEEQRAKFAEGDLLDLQTTTKSNLVSAINEVNTNLGDMFEKSGQDIIFSGNLVPALNSAFSIGSATHVIKDFFVSANTIHLGDSTTLSGTSLTVDAGDSPTSISDQPTIVAGRLVAKPFTYNAGGGDVTVRPSIEFQDEGGISNPISFNSATGEFSFDRQGNFGQGLVRAKVGTFVNAGQTALDVTGNSAVDGDLAVTGSLRADGEVFLGYQASDIVHVRGTLDIDTPITLTSNASIGDGNDDVTINSGPANLFTVASKFFNIDNLGNTTAQNVTVQGNLTVAGTTTTAHSEVITFADNKLELNSNVVSGAPTEDAGLSVRRGDNGLLDILVWNETLDVVTVPVGSGSSFTHEQVATRPYVTSLTTPITTTQTNMKGATGLNADGTYSAPVGSNYIDGATSVKDATVILDSEIKARADAIAGLGSTKFDKAGGTITGDTTVDGKLTVNSNIHGKGGVLFLGATTDGIDQAIRNDSTNILLGNTAKGLKTFKDLETVSGHKYYHEGFKPKYSDGESLFFGDANDGEIKFVAAENNLKIASTNNGGLIELATRNSGGSEVPVLTASGTAHSSLYHPATNEEVLRSNTKGIEVGSEAGNRTKLYNGSAGQLAVATDFGWGTFGAGNSSYLHIATDRSKIHMNKPLYVDTSIQVYGTDTYLTGSAGKIGGADILTTTSGRATDSTLFDGLASSKFLRSDVADTANQLTIQNDLIMSNSSASLHMDTNGIKGIHCNSGFGNFHINSGIKGDDKTGVAGDGAVKLTFTSDGAAGGLAIATAAANPNVDTAPALKNILTVDSSMMHAFYAGAEKLRTQNTGIRAYGASTANIIDIYSDGTNSFYATNTGNLYLYNSAAGKHLYGQVKNVDGTTDVPLRVVSGASNGNAYVDLRYGDNQKLRTVSSGVQVTGNLTASGDITAFSDINTKKDIETLTGALEGIKGIRGVTYVRKSDDEESIGVIAQELEEYFPQLVKTSEDGTKHVAYGNIAGVLIEGVKELASENDKANAKIKDLEAKYNDLASKVEQLLAK